MCAKFPAHICRHQRFLRILLWVRKTSRLLGNTSQTGTNSTSPCFVRDLGSQECFLIRGFQRFLTGSSTLSKSAHILVDKPVDCGYSAGLLDCFFGKYLGFMVGIIHDSCILSTGLRPPFGLITPNCVAILV